MNCALPGSPSRRGPPRQAYQYVFLVPSANVATVQCRPLAFTRMLADPVFHFVSAFAAGRCLRVGHGDDLAVVEFNPQNRKARGLERADQSGGIVQFEGMATQRHNRPHASYMVPTLALKCAECNKSLIWLTFVNLLKLVNRLILALRVYLT